MHACTQLYRHSSRNDSFIDTARETTAGALTCARMSAARAKGLCHAFRKPLGLEPAIGPPEDLYLDAFT
jgi:alcohol dehydrogenase class IV